MCAFLCVFTVHYALRLSILFCSHSHRPFFANWWQTQFHRISLDEIQYFRTLMLSCLSSMHRGRTNNNEEKTFCIHKICHTVSAVNCSYKNRINKQLKRMDPLKTFHRNLVIAVLKASKQDFGTLNDIQKNQNGENVLRLEGLPWDSKEHDIREFFLGNGIICFCCTVLTHNSSIIYWSKSLAERFVRMCSNPNPWYVCNCFTN